MKKLLYYTVEFLLFLFLLTCTIHYELISLFSGVTVFSAVIIKAVASLSLFQREYTNNFHTSGYSSLITLIAIYTLSANIVAATTMILLFLPLYILISFHSKTSAATALLHGLSFITTITLIYGLTTELFPTSPALIINVASGFLIHTPLSPIETTIALVLTATLLLAAYQNNIQKSIASITIDTILFIFSGLLIPDYRSRLYSKKMSVLYIRAMVWTSFITLIGIGFSPWALLISPLLSFIINYYTIKKSRSLYNASRITFINK